MRTRESPPTSWHPDAVRTQRIGIVRWGLAAAIAALSLSATPSRSHGQDVNALIGEGKFEEAVRASAGATATAADGLATRILEQSVAGYARGDFDYAIRGLRAAKTLPGLTRDRSEELDYHLAWSLYSAAERDQRPQTRASAEATLPLFLEAKAIVNRIDRSVYDVFGLASSIEEYVLTQTFLTRQP